MIKIIYLASIPVLLLLILIFGILQFTYISPVINQEMTRTTENLIRNSPAASSSEFSPTQSNPPMPIDIWKNNIFDSSRALISEGGGGSASLKDVILLGVFDDGKTAGAVFLMANAQSGVPGGYAAPNRSYSQPGAPGQDAPPKPKMVFLVGERLPNGFVIKSVSRDSVILQGGEDSTTLNMDFADEESAKRLAEAMRGNVQQQVRIIETSKQGSGGTSSGGASSSNVVIRNAPESKQGGY